MIRELTSSDIKGLNRIKPEDWNFDYEAFVSHYIQCDFYFAFGIIENGLVVSTGNLFFNGKVGWLANVIVDENQRNKGLGFQMTNYLVQFLKSKNGKTHLLIATALGEPVYKKLGFEKVSEYICFDIHISDLVKISKNIRPLVESDLKEVYKLDEEANDEDRMHFMRKYYKTGLGYFNKNNELVGFFLPYFGQGLVISKDENVGIELLKVKHSKPGRRSLIPIENTEGIKFMESYGVRTESTAIRMVLGEKNTWKPKNVFSYGGGYCG